MTAPTETDMQSTEGALTKQPLVIVDGRRVTLTFELPFVAGDACVTPRHYKATTVSLMPEVAIRLRDNLQKVDVQCGGAWYAADHTQMHGPREFLPDMQALLRYWLDERSRDYFEDRLPALLRLFADDAPSLARLQARRLELLRSELNAAKSELSEAAISATRKVMDLEAEIAAATGAQHV